MGLRDFFEKEKRKFVIKEVERMPLPKFKETDISRKRIVFEGLVQEVGFRFETQMIAIRLGMTGKAINQQDGSVLVEVQGAQDKIDCMISMLYRVRRFRIDHCTVSDLPVIPGEDGFICR